MELPALMLGRYLTSGNVVEATFENRQRKLLSIVTIVGLPVFLRQQGSPRSKPVDAAPAETGE